MNYLNAPDYLAVAMSLVTTLTSVLASLFFKGFQFRTLRYSIGLDAVTPILILGLPFPLAHVALSAYSSFAYTGSNFVGSFLFAGYNRWLGAIRSSVLTMIILAVAQIIAVGISILMRGDYLILFTIVLAAKMIALVLASTTIPEVAIVPDEMARTYSSMLYDKTVTGYRFSVELSKETIMTTLRLIALAVILLMLYVIYRTLGLVAF
jgi:hypothetical protein